MSTLAARLRPGLRFAAVGHVTNDLLASGPQPGGSAFYATLTARALGAEATAVTSCAGDWTGRARLAEAGVRLIEHPSAVTTCFENLYVDGRRQDRLIARADPLPLTLPPDAQVALACPVMGELADVVLEVPPHVLLGAGIQGWLREVTAGGRIRPRPLEDARVFKGCAVVFLSEQDLDEALTEALAALRAVVPRVVLTRGPDGSTVFERERTFEVRAFPAREVDPTGAGDVYAAAFLLALASGHPSAEAARIASVAAACAVEAPGADGLARLGGLDDRGLP